MRNYMTTKQLLMKIDLALLDWYNTCNPDFADIERKEQSIKIIMDNGGAQEYIKLIRYQIHQALGNN